MQPPVFPVARPSSARRPPGIFALPFGIIVLLAGLWGGLARLGYVLPNSGTSFAQHGILMSIGFLGTLISTERAVALGSWWAWGVPALSAFGSLYLVAGGIPWIGYGALFVAGVDLVCVYGRLHQIQASTHNTLMGLAAVGWAVAALLAMGGRPVSDTVPWLAIFLVVTITAERLELSRMLKRSAPVRISLVVAIALMVAGATVSIWRADLGMRLTGVAMVAMAVWLMIYDLARRTIRASGVTRFMAAGLLTGYVWLAGGGVLWAIAGDQVGNPIYDGAAVNPLYDAELHTIFLGFVMSMVFAHAPVIAPAVVRKPLPYYPVFYAPLALLHLSLLLRVVVGDAAGMVHAWQMGGILGEIAILAFVAVTVGAFIHAARGARRQMAARLAARAAAGQVPHPVPAIDQGVLMTESTTPASSSNQPPQAGAEAGAGGAPTSGAPVADAPLSGTPAARAPHGTASTIVGSLIGVAILIGAVIYANSGGSGQQAAAPEPTTVISAAEAAAGVDVSLVEMRIEPSTLVVEPGAHLVLKVTNNGTMQHDLYLATGQGTELLAPGQSAVLDAGVIDAAVDGWCTVPGHRQAGMTMTITVAGSETGTAGSGPGATGANAPGGMDHMGSAGSSGTAGAPDAVSKDLAAAPPADWQPIDASLPPADGATVHDITWHITDVETAVAPDVTQLLWTFDGRVPGPALRGKVGDRFNVTLVNDTAMTHNIDFHAESGPPAKVMTPVDPGQSHTYSFVATHAGAWLYHCGIAPMLQHMGNGMYGALIIDPPDLPRADREYVLVGSELFFGPQGQIGDYAKMLANQPDAVVFNGYPFAYDHAPLPAKVGELVRIWVVDAGPTRPIGFHVIGAPFTTLYLNGAYQLKDGRSAGAESGAAQTLPVDPGNGGFVELRFTDSGSYPFVSHAMADSAIGAMGSFQVTD